MKKTVNDRIDRVDLFEREEQMKKKKEGERGRCVVTMI